MSKNTQRLVWLIIGIGIVIGLLILTDKHPADVVEEVLNLEPGNFEIDEETSLIDPSEIISGGPGKDGIPSIDDPEFESVEKARDWLLDTDPGIGLSVNGEVRFYPYKVLVWHEIVNDEIGGEPVLVTYCPLCATGVVYNPSVNGVDRDFGVSGNLWRSNLLMYDRTGNPTTESLWSQVLGQAVTGVSVGTKLDIIPSEITRLGDWIKKYPDTEVLSQETGVLRNYQIDPYGDYYTDNSEVWFGVNVDERLESKALVAGIELPNGDSRAYNLLDLRDGSTLDNESGITINKSADQIEFQIDGQTLPHIIGFWFSWAAAHPDTSLYRI